MRRLAAVLLAGALAALAPAAEAPPAPTPLSLPEPLVQRLLSAYVFVGGGSGVLIGRDGLVLTNHHVIDGLDDLTVRTADGRVWPTRLLGTDPVGDIAALRIDAEALRESGISLAGAEFAPVEALAVGTPVAAVGNPFSLGDYDDVPTLTSGVLGTGRMVRGDYSDAIQSDAPVNPGNSGGPLFDLQGRLLGINGQIRSLTGFRINSGIGLAIASPQLQAFLPVLAEAEGGYARHTAAPKGLELKQARDGVEVAAAGGSGLSVGDRLLRIAGRPVTSLPTAIGLFASLPWRIGVTADVVVRRGAVEETVTVALGRTGIPGRPYHGLTFAESRGQTVIEAVDAGSPGAEAGLTAGSTVLAVDGKPVTSKITLLRALVGAEIGDRPVFSVKDRTGTERTAMVLFRHR